MHFATNRNGGIDTSLVAMDEQAIGKELGEAGFRSLVAEFYRQVRNDDVIGPMYPNDDWEGAEQRLCDFLIFRFGISDRYIHERGHPRLRMRHAPFAIGSVERDRWLELMRAAIQQTDVSDMVSKDLTSFLEHVADFLRNK